MSGTITLSPRGTPISSANSASGSGAAALLDTSTPQGKFAITLLAVYIFLIVSRVLDLSPIWWLHIPLISLVLLTIVTFARNGIRYALTSKITKLFGAFSVWVLICFPFSTWRAGSLDSTRQAAECFLVFLLIVEAIRTPSNWRKVAGAYAYAVVVASIYSFFYARMIDGRLALVGGTFGDPNEFALTVLSGVPFILRKANASSSFKKLFFWLAMIPPFITIARTGSRGGLLALATMLVVTFFLAKAGQRALICAVTIVGILASVALLPSYLKNRYLTLSSSGGSNVDARTQDQLNSDVASSEGREMLLKQSIRLTFEHPLFGVGPGAFSYAAWDERKAESGMGGIAFVSHNTYTQISSETGIPGFIFFIGAVILSLKYTFTDYRSLVKTDPDLAKLGRYFLMSMIPLCVGIFFLSLGYTHFITVFLAMATALHNVVQDERRRRVGAGLVETVGTAHHTGAPDPRTSISAPLASSTIKTRRTPSYSRSRGLTKGADTGHVQAHDRTVPSASDRDSTKRD